MARIADPELNGPQPQISLDQAIKKALTRELAEHGRGPRSTVMDKAQPLHSVWRQQLSGLLGHISYKEILAFCRQLAMLLDCGMPMVAALSTLTRRTSSRALSAIIREIGMAVEAGASFTDAVSRHARHFPGLAVSMIRAGETSGNLIKALYRVADQGEKMREAKEKAAAALVYPAFVLLTALGVILFAFSHLMSRCQELLDQFGAETPAMMSMMLRFGTYVLNWGHWLYFAVVVVILLLGYKFIAVHIPAFRLLRDRLMLRIPLVRHFAMNALVARFARVFSMLLESGVPLLETLHAAKNTISNELMRLTIDRMRETIQQGGRMAPVIERAGVFPPLVCDMVAVGEEAGALVRVFDKVADVYESQIETDLSTFAALIKPAMVIILGGVVLLVALAFFSVYSAMLSATPKAF